MTHEVDLQGWAEGERRNAVEFADALGVPPELYTSDPMVLIPALQDYVSRAPFSEFEQSDWVTLHADLMSYVADYLINKHGARWSVENDPASPRGYRYVIAATGRDGRSHVLDPLQLVGQEFTSLPIDITRMLAGAELALGLASPTSSDR
ncbi:hypothetical protein [Streptomyces sp. NPDC002176]|uniref:hypothetical protein n=1 Tax=Streptomyces sp. NPDC002176 TaxID=3364634 RepID=UPI00384D41E1